MQRPSWARAARSSISQNDPIASPALDRSLARGGRTDSLTKWPQGHALDVFAFSPATCPSSRLRERALRGVVDVRLTASREGLCALPSASALASGPPAPPRASALRLSGRERPSHGPKSRTSQARQKREPRAGTANRTSTTFAAVRRLARGTRRDYSKARGSATLSPGAESRELQPPAACALGRRKLPRRASRPRRAPRKEIERDARQEEKERRPSEVVSSNFEQDRSRYRRDGVRAGDIMDVGATAVRRVADATDQPWRVATTRRAPAEV